MRYVILNQNSPFPSVLFDSVGIIKQFDSFNEAKSDGKLTMYDKLRKEYIVVTETTK